jgi:methylglutamate dehydrogenase subunit D
MADTGRVLAEVMKPGRYGRTGGGLRLGEKPLGTLIQMSAWGSEVAAFAPLLSALRLPGLPDFGKVSEVDDVLTLHLGPGRLWLRSDEPGRLLAKLEGIGLAQCAKLDLSSTRTVIAVTGDAAEDLMARLVTVDCSGRAFPPGRFALTVLHDVSVLVRRCDDRGFEVWVPVTWARSLWSYVCEAARPLGYEVAQGV